MELSPLVPEQHDEPNQDPAESSGSAIDGNGFQLKSADPPEGGAAAVAKTMTEKTVRTVSSNERPAHSSSRATSVTQLKLREKLSLISGKTLWFLAGVPRLKIPSIRVADGPHGVRKPVKEMSLQRAHPATCFPTAAALACSWDPEVVRQVGRALRTECLHYGIQVLLGPGMNLKRHSTGGRNFEYFSEDPYLTGQLAVAYIKGVQSSGQVAACAKHLAVNNQESHRFVVNSVVDERTLRELYLRHFETVVKEAKPLSMMCAYNKVNGQYCSEHEHLNVEILRKEWGYDGVLMSDWGAVNDRPAGIRAQLDLEMPGSHGVHHREIRSALYTQHLTEAEIDTCAQRVLTLIDQVRQDRAPTSEAPASTSSERTSFSSRSVTQQECSWPVQHNIAKSTALECAVLLQNKDCFLPLNRSEVESVAVIGGFGKTCPRYQGMGSSHVNAEWARAAFDEVFRFCDNVTFAQGYDVDDEDVENANAELLEEAIGVASAAQVVLLCVGLPEIMESEGFDRPHMKMPAQHVALVTEICKINPNVIVALSNGAAVEMPWADDATAIFECFLLGEAGGAALVDLIFGTQSPSGKLAETIPLQQSDILADRYFPGTRDTVEHREGLDVGYRYFDSANQPVLFPFGHGLTYTTFEYTELKTHIICDEMMTKEVMVTFTLRNSGGCSAKEVVQCYIHQPDASVYRPIHELKAFDKIFLHPGETRQVQLRLSFDAFSFYDVGAKDWVVEKGPFEVRIGASSRDIRLTQTLLFARGQSPSEEARLSYPPRTYGVREGDVDDGTFARRFGPAARLPLTKTDSSSIASFDRNSLLKEVAADTSLGKLLMWAVFKGATSDLKPGPTMKRDKKIMEAAVQNLPLRTMVLFGGGGLSFELMDAMIESMNGSIGKALRLYCVAFTPFRRKATFYKPAT